MAPDPGTNLGQILRRLETFVNDPKIEVSTAAVMLYETCLSLQSSLVYIRNNAECCTALETLCDEIVTEFAFESLMVSNDLSLREYRPRTSFAVLPHPSEWVTVARLHNLTVERLAMKPIEPRPRERPLLSILLPVTNGYRRTYRALVGICYDLGEHFLDKYNVDFHVCVNYTDDNSLYEVTRFASTVAAARNVNLSLYHAEHPQFAGDAPKPGWVKVVVLNVLLRTIYGNSTDWGCSPDQHVLHFADDDIRFMRVPRDKLKREASGVIEGNIGRLRNNLKLKMISGTYIGSEDWAFSALSSVRKFKQYVMEADNLLNLYGGCLTTTAERLASVLPKSANDLQFLGPQLPWRADQAFSEDCFLTMYANLGYLDRGAAQDPLAFANAKAVVGHPEPGDPISYSQRLARDFAWGAAAANEVANVAGANMVGAAILSAYSAARAKSFIPIQQAIQLGVHSHDAPPPSWRHILAQEWLRLIRERVERESDLWSEERSRWRWVKWSQHKTHHQICRDIVEDDDVYHSIVSELSRAQTPAAQELSQAMLDARDRRRELFPGLSRQLAEIRTDGLRDASALNAHLFHWHAIAREDSEYSAALDSPERLQSGRNPPFRQYPLFIENVAALCRIRGDAPNAIRRLRETRNSRNVQLRWTNGDPQQIYLRYFPVTGVVEFSPNSPRRSVYLHVLGEQLVSQILTRAAHLINAHAAAEWPLELPRTIYPHLEDATLNYAGPESRSPFNRFMQRTYLQQYVSNVAILREHRFDLDTMRATAKAVASFLGRLHGPTVGIRLLLEHCYVYRHGHDEWIARHTYRAGVVKILLEHLDQWRLFETKDYRKWLDAGCDDQGSSLSIVSLFNAQKRKANPVLKEVNALLRQNRREIEDLWKDLVEGSCRFHEKFGAVGHLAVRDTNILVSLSDSSRIYVPSHYRIGMVDPAIDGALALADLVWRYHEMALESSDPVDGSIPGDKSLFEVARAFLTAYQESLRMHLDPALTQQPSRNAVLDRAKDIPGVMTRLSRFAAMTILARRQALETRGLPREDLCDVRLAHTCFDLLETGTQLGLLFRDPRRT